MIHVTECLRLVVTSTFVFTLDDYESDLTSEKSKSNRFTWPIFNVRVQVVSRLIFQCGDEKFAVTIFKRLVSNEFFSKLFVILSRAIVESYCSRFVLRGSLRASLTTSKLSSWCSKFEHDSNRRDTRGNQKDDQIPSIRTLCKLGVYVNKFSKWYPSAAIDLSETINRELSPWRSPYKDYRKI